MDYGIFNMCTDVNACDCAQGCTDTIRESALKVDSGRKIPCRTLELNLCQQRAELHPHPFPVPHSKTSKSVIMTKLPGSSQTVIFIRRTKVFANTIFEHYSLTMFMKIVYVLRTGFTPLLGQRTQHCSRNCGALPSTCLEHTSLWQPPASDCDKTVDH